MDPVALLKALLIHAAYEGACAVCEPLIQGGKKGRGSIRRESGPSPFPDGFLFDRQGHRWNDQFFGLADDFLIDSTRTSGGTPISSRPVTSTHCPCSFLMRSPKSFFSSGHFKRIVCRVNPSPYRMYAIFGFVGSGEGASGPWISTLM
jgi:hypothetical protein